ncbi:hypothetical protein [Candidatus Tremblaya princeps]|uniref:hypothetical protein n=1 Tax=Tremblaya princeps TaxID=189385 RepID=UPI00094663F9
MYAGSVRGTTPNPDDACNCGVKLGALAAQARSEAMRAWQRGTTHFFTPATDCGRTGPGFVHD